MKVILAFAMVALIARGTADHEGVQELSETQTAAHETIGFDDFNFNAESEGWVDMGDAPDMGEAIGGCDEKCTSANKKCYKTSQDKCYGHSQESCALKSGHVWCGVTPAPTPAPYICPTTVNTADEANYWLNKAQCLASELSRLGESDNVMVSASGNKQCVDSLNTAQYECGASSDCDSEKFEAANQALMTKGCDSMNHKPDCCASNNCDASACWVGLDVISSSGAKSKGKVVKKSMNSNTVSLNANGVRYMAVMDLDMTVKRVSYCIKDKKRCFTQKACGDLTMTVHSLKKQKDGTTPADYEWQSTAIPAEGDAEYQALETAKEEKGAELVRMICNSARL